MMSRAHGAGDQSGFTLMEVLMITAIIGIMAGIALPALNNEVEMLKLGMSTREVQSELQTARLKAVSANTYMRVRFNCPAAGQFRMVERIGTPFAADTGDDLDANATVRCTVSTYPYKHTGSDTNRLTRPNNDGSLRSLQQKVAFSTTAGLTSTGSKVLEFWPDGSVHVNTATPWPQVGAAGVTIVLTKGTTTKTITVTSLGNIQMQR